MKAARTWFRLWWRTWEPVVPILRPFRSLEGEAQAAETARARVPMRSTGADRPVIVMIPRNKGGAKGKGHPGLFDGQPQGMSR